MKWSCPSKSRGSCGKTSPVTTMVRELPPGAAVFIDGGYLEHAFQKYGKTSNPLPALFAELERVYQVRITRKELHQGTRDGKPNESHKRYRSAEGGKVDIILYEMKDQTGRSPHGAWGSRSTIRVERGVDVGLGLAMQEMPAASEEPYSVVVVITGDGDLERAFKKSPHTVYACSLKSTISFSLEPYVKVAPNGERIYLDGILCSAFRGAPCMFFPSEEEGETESESGSVVEEPKLVKCFAGSICEKIKDPSHLSKYRHPCPEGVACSIIYEDADNEDRKRHLSQWGHVCSIKDCKGDEVHKSVCEHPRQGKDICLDSDCSQVWNKAHARVHRHRCPDDRKCPLMKRVSTDLIKIMHMRDYMHTCSFGKSCLYIRDPEWNWEHMLQFLHPRRSCELSSPARTSEVASRAAAPIPSPLPQQHQGDTPCLHDTGSVPHPYPRPPSRSCHPEWSGGEEVRAMLCRVAMPLLPRVLEGAKHLVSAKDRPLSPLEGDDEQGKKEAAVDATTAASSAVSSQEPVPLDKKEEEAEEKETSATKTPVAVVATSEGGGPSSKGEEAHTSQRQPSSPLGADLPDRGAKLCRHDKCKDESRWPDYLCTKHGGGRCHGLSADSGQPCTSLWHYVMPQRVPLCMRHALETVQDQEVEKSFRDVLLKEEGVQDLGALSELRRKVYRNKYLAEKGARTDVPAWWRRAKDS